MVEGKRLQVNASAVRYQRVTLHFAHCLVGAGEIEIDNERFEAGHLNLHTQSLCGADTFRCFRGLAAPSHRSRPDIDTVVMRGTTGPLSNLWLVLISDKSGTIGSANRDRHRL
jgi:hypothetical protein